MGLWVYGFMGLWVYGGMRGCGDGGIHNNFQFVWVKKNRGQLARGKKYASELINSSALHDDALTIPLWRPELLPIGRWVP